eukprot:CAMPEP_0119394954 /NCGR_PEP_ID=MMETSP1334-20130426/131530_1 /TAXON_ID=127549 /ORGANISM="Calcidiscus leptoporus, Strain RCC1130" /LENGTH=38 /DNA_ID= /DNA_START= /DNA_END= /DNA_ORIENTATION=
MKPSCLRAHELWTQAIAAGLTQRRYGLMKERAAFAKAT